MMYNVAAGWRQDLIYLEAGLYFQLQLFDRNKDGKLQLSEMAK